MSGSANAPKLTNFTAGDLVVSVVGDGDGSGTYGDNQAAPIVLEELTTSGQEVGQETLPQTATTNAQGTTENSISGEYGSSSEGSLELSADGKSLVIAGYGVNDTTYNQGEESGNDVYGNAALAQSTSLTNQTTDTPVARVIADIGYNNTIDTSTALFNVFNTNNPRSVATINGKTFYITGQGVKGDTTQGVFLAQDGASSATAIDTSSDTRTAEIYNGKLYVSRDSKQADGGSIGSYGATPPTGATAPTTLPGIAATVTLTAAQENSVNGGAVGQSVELSPENYFFANPTTLYVADGGQPKEGGIGDGGLQKWTLNPATGVWTLQYTLSAGLNLVENNNAGVSSDTSGTTGLIGLTGVVHADGTVTLYTTNSTIGDLDQTYVYSITDTVTATTPGLNESFAVIDTAAADTNVRGIALAPAATGVSTIIGAGQTTPTALIISTGDSLTVSAGGAAVAVVVNSGGTASIAGSDTNTLIQALGTETVTGQATGDQVWGTQSVTGAGASASNETVEYGGVIDIFGGAKATSITVDTSGGLTLGGGSTANNVVVNGGSIVLQSAQDALGGLVSNFTPGAVIDAAFIGAGAVLTTSLVNGNTNVTITSGTAPNAVSESFTLAGKFTGETFAANYVAGSGTELTVSVTSGVTIVSSGQSTPANFVVSSGNTLDVLPGGSAAGVKILNGGSANFAGVDTGTVISSGGNATVTGSQTNATLLGNGGETIGSGGSATGGQVYGAQTVLSGGSATSETVYNGGLLTVQAGGSATSTTISAGGSASFAGTDTGTVISGGSVTVLGTETNATILAAGSETVSGTATGDQIYGTQNVSAGTAVVNNETVFNGGALDLYTSGVVANNIVLSGGTLNISGNATAYNTVIQGGSISLQSPKASLANGVTFAGAGAIFVTSKVASAGFGDLATISGFGTNDFIEVTSSLTGSSTKLKFASAGATATSVTISGSSGSETFIFNGASAVVAASLQLVTSGGYEIIEAACFCAGTNIRTPDGNAPVETLKIGDIVLTAAGQAVPVRWVGINTVSTRFADPLRVMPIRIRAGALGENLPERDLLLSPDHAMFLGGLLLQAGALVNGSSITREARMPEIFTYYHVEVANHELILAEGAPTETFVDYIGRMSFDNWAEHQALYGNEADIEEMPYPRVRSARQLPMAMRRLLAARAAAICATALAG